MPPGLCRLSPSPELAPPVELRVLDGDGYFARGKYDQELALRRETEQRLALLRRAAADIRYVGARKRRG